MSTLIRAVARQCTRPIKALVYPLLAWLVRRVSQRFASEIQPVEQLAWQVRTLTERQDKLEAIYWDQSALARRLSVIEDHLESLILTRRASEGIPGAGEGAPGRLEFNSAGITAHDAPGQPALRCVRAECERLAEGPDETGLLRTG